MFSGSFRFCLRSLLFSFTLKATNQLVEKVMNLWKLYRWIHEYPRFVLAKQAPNALFRSLCGQWTKLSAKYEEEKYIFCAGKSNSARRICEQSFTMTPRVSLSWQQQRKANHPGNQSEYLVILCAATWRSSYPKLCHWTKHRYIISHRYISPHCIQS